MLPSQTWNPRRRLQGHAQHVVLSHGVCTAGASPKKIQTEHHQGLDFGPHSTREKEALNKAQLMVVIEGKQKEAAQTEEVVSKDCSRKQFPERTWHAAPFVLSLVFCHGLG